MGRNQAIRGGFGRRRFFIAVAFYAIIASSAFSVRIEAASPTTPKQTSAVKSRSSLIGPSAKTLGTSFFADPSEATQSPASAVQAATTTDGRVLLQKRVPPAAPTVVQPTTTTTATMTPQPTATTTNSTSATAPVPQTAGAQPTADYRGVPFVTQAAPVLKFERRSTPRLRGIDYDFAEQTAQGVALFSRFPAFTMSDRRIHVSGPWYDNAEANGHFTHGITAVEAMPNYRAGADDMRNIPNSHKWLLMTDPLWYIYSNILANELAASNPNDPRIVPLRGFADNHVVPTDVDALVSLGHRAWRGERYSTDSSGKGFVYPMVDIETSAGWEHQRDSYGYLYKGIIDEAATYGVSIVPVLYGQGTFSIGTVADSSIDNNTGWPEYLSPNKDFLGWNDPTLYACETTRGVISMDGYMQAIWGLEPFYKRNADGTLQLSGGQPIFNNITTTNLYGASIRLETAESSHCLQDIYRQATRMYLMHHWRAGQYPANTELRRSYLWDTRIGAWSRITNEGLQGIEQNDRPLPGWLMEMLVGMYLFTADDVVLWSSDTNHPPRPLGANNTSTWQYNAHGVIEYVVKAAHRYSALDALHQGSYQWCWFHLPMVKQNTADGERYYQKPLVFGKIRTYNGQQWMELFAAWPGLDNQSTDLKLWIEKDGGRSPVYTIQLANGRSYFYDAWQLPAGLTNLEGKHVKLQFKDQMGALRTWCGDYRVTQ